MNDRRLQAEDPVLARSYPAFRDPLPGESLAGFMLALDELNCLDAGQTARATGKHGSSPAKFGTGYFLSGLCFDLKVLGDLAGGAQLANMLTLTTQPLMAWLLTDRQRSSASLAQSAGFRICPLCFEESKLWPLLLLFDEITGCHRHGMRLVTNCTCGAPIKPFARQTPGRCHEFRCEVSYADLPRVALSEDEAQVVRRRAAVLEDLLGFAETRPQPLTTKQLAAGLRALIYGRPNASTQLFARIQPRPHVAGIVDILSATGSTAAELDAASRVSRAAVARGMKAVPIRVEGVCPNRACTGKGETCKDGRLPTTGERQYVCMRCGTRFTKSRVLFAFDDLPDYPSWRALANRTKLDTYRAAVAQVCAKEQRHTYMAVERVFRLARVPSAAPYQSNRAGLVAVVARSNIAAGVRNDKRLAGIAIRPATP